MAEIVSSEKTKDGDFILLVRASPKEVRKVGKGKRVFLIPEEKAKFIAPPNQELTEKLSSLNLHENMVIVTPRTRLRTVELNLIEFFEETRPFIIFVSCEIPYHEMIEIIKFREMLLGSSINQDRLFFLSCVEEESKECKERRGKNHAVVAGLTNLTDMSIIIEEAAKAFLKRPDSARPIILVIDSWSRILKANPPSSSEKFAEFIVGLLNRYPMIGVFIFKWLEYRDDGIVLTNPKFYVRV